jgi:hypothetical protein
VSVTLCCTVLYIVYLKRNCLIYIVSVLSNIPVFPDVFRVPTCGNRNLTELCVYITMYINVIRVKDSFLNMMDPLDGYR